MGETDNGRTAVKMTKEIIYTVVLMDLAMPDMNGIEAIRQIKAEAADTKFWSCPCIRPGDWYG